MELFEKYMVRCFELAGKGKGYVSPNPLVGALIVKDDKIIGEGFHKKYGGNHAEVEVVENSIEDVNGATLYCNLEPCCHENKKTPPCVPLIISKKVAKVVISNLDPNPSVNGKGIKQLKDAGIDVVTGILEEDGKELNKFYFNYVRKGIPYITIKIAQSSDYKITKSLNEQTWLTGKEAMQYVHQRRAEYDAVLVGANTIRVDDPQLTVREVEGRNPIRIVLDGKLSIPLDSKVVQAEDTEKTWIITDEKSDKEKINKLTDLGIKILILTEENGKINLEELLKKLADNNITSLFVEGGKEIFNQFISYKFFNDIIILQSPKKLGSGVEGFNFNSETWIESISFEELGEDVKIIMKKKE